MRIRYYDMKGAENAATQGKNAVPTWKFTSFLRNSGHIFVTDEDVKCSKKLFRLDPVGRATIAVLRHLGLLKESRGKGLTRFIVTRNNAL